jgi:uncharacterized protein YneF (UPF0154 family)
MEFKEDKLFSTMRIEQLDSLAREDIYHEAMEANFEEFEKNAERLRTGPVEHKVFSFFMVLVFLLAVGGMIFFLGFKHNVPAGVFCIGALMTFLPVVVMAFPDNRKRRAGLFLFMVTGLALMIPSALKLFVPICKDLPLLVVIACLLFILIGGYFIAYSLIRIKRRNKECTAEVVADIIGYKYKIHTSRVDGTTGSYLVCTPVYSYIFEGNEYKAYDNSLWSTVTSGIQSEKAVIHLDPNDPYSIATTNFKRRQYISLNVGILALVVGIFIGVLSFLGSNQGNDYSNYEIVHKDGRVVLTEEVIYGDYLENLDNSSKMLTILLAFFIGLDTVLAFVSISIFINTRKKIANNQKASSEEEGKRKKNNGWTPFYCSCVAFGFILLLVLAMGYSLISANRARGDELSVISDVVTDKYVEERSRMINDDGHETKDYTYHIVCEDEGDRIVSQAVYRSLEMNGEYFLILNEDGGIVNVYSASEFIYE